MSENFKEAAFPLADYSAGFTKLELASLEILKALISSDGHVYESRFDISIDCAKKLLKKLEEAQK